MSKTNNHEFTSSAELKERVEKLESRTEELRQRSVELEENLLQFALIVKRFLTNPKIKAAFGGAWSDDPKIQSLLETTNVTDPAVSPTPQASENS